MLELIQKMGLAFIFELLLGIVVLIIAIKATFENIILRKYLERKNEIFKDKFNITEDIL